MSDEETLGRRLSYRSLVSGIPVVVAVASLVVSYLAFRNSEGVALREEARAVTRQQVFMASKLKRDQLIIRPTDPAKQVLNFVIQYPANAFGDVNPPIVGTLGGGTLGLAGLRDYLWERFREMKQVKSLSSPAMGAVPVIFYTRYSYEGATVNDRSLYYVFYLLVPDGEDVKVVPQLINYCGRLKEDDPDVEFLIDPWLPKPVGYDDRPSQAMMFGCDSPNILWIGSKAGRFEVETKMLADARESGHGDVAQMQLGGTESYRFIPVGADAVEVAYRLTVMDSPPFLYPKSGSRFE